MMPSRDLQTAAICTVRGLRSAGRQSKYLPDLQLNPRLAPRICSAPPKAAGADAADALFVENVSASVSYRLGKLEDVERSESADLGLRVFVGQTGRVRLLERFLQGGRRRPARAAPWRWRKLAPEDKFACLAPRERLATIVPALDTRRCRRAVRRHAGRARPRRGRRRRWR